ncbi:MAG: SpoIIE family protein phosphatase [Candidatus Riflebacteria bacterium]|nr:SpoIIE family protein phosphatase [Candidatus Riflebacteria bacterium]
MFNNALKGSLSSWINLTLSVLFFAGLPNLLIFFAYNFVESHRYQNKKIELLREADRSLFRLKKDGGDLSYVQNKTDKAFGELSEKKINSSTIKQQLAQFKRDDLEFIEFYFFDKSGKIIKTVEDEVKFRTALGRLYLALSEPESSGQDKLLQQYRPVFKTLLGDMEPTNLIGMKGVYVPIFLNGKPGYFYWNTFYQSEENQIKTKAGAGDPVFQGGMIAVFEEKNFKKNISIAKMLKELNVPGTSHALFGCYDPSDTDFSRQLHVSSSSAKLDIRECENTIWNMRKTFINKDELKGFLISIVLFEDEKVLYSLIPAIQLENRTNLYIFFIAAFMITLVVFSVSYRINISGEFRYFSIRKKLILLFLYATAIPTGAFVLLGFQYVSENKQVMISERFQFLTDFINNIDENYKLALNQLKTKYSRLTKSDFLLKRDMTKLSELVENWRNERLINSVYLGEDTGELTFKSDKVGKNDFVLKVIMTMMKKMFTKKNPNLNKQKQNFFTEAMMDTLADSLGSLFGAGGSKAIFEEFLRKTDEMHEVVLGNSAQYFFLSFVPGPEGPYQSMIIINQLKRDLTDIYLNWIIKKQAKNLQKQFSVKVGFRRNFSNSMLTPKDFSKYPALTELTEKAMNNKSAQTGFIQIAADNYLAVASPIKNLSDYIIFALYPQSLIDKTIDQITYKMLGVAFLSGIFAFMTGLMISKQFLYPIRELSEGLSAIEMRKFNHKIPPLANDEFGDLGNTFNRMMENLSEIQVAKIVQDTLFPAKNLKVGNFEVTGSSISMSDLGGDYFDYFVADDRYLVILIGDVTGHGISAALLMAMAKSAIASLPQDALCDPVESLQRVHSMVLSTVKRKKLMTFFYSVIDMEKNMFSFSNAGHCPPIYFSNAEKKLTAMELPSFPLGSRKKIDFQRIDKQINSGDVIILYTDGFPETITDDGSMIGYPGVEKIAFDSIMNFSSSSQVHENILRKYDSIRNFRPREDDITLLVIKCE